MAPQSRAVTVVAPTGGLVRLVRALLSLVVLAVLLVALPVALLYGTLALAGPGGTAHPAGLSGLLTGPDQGAAFAWALAAVGWLAWASFALGVLVELPAQVRGRVARRLPAIGWSQRSAALLLGALFAVLPAAGALAATPASAPATVSAPLTAAERGAAQPSVEQSTVEQPTVGYTVRAARPAETLWSIAQDRLGSGARWNEIARLNEGRVLDAHGTVFHADSPLTPGWVLLLPQSEPAAVTVTVHQGDTLSAIADAHHVEGGWESVYAENRQVIGPNPNVIEPGERLTLPPVPNAAAPNTAPAPVTTAPQVTAPPVQAPAARRPSVADAFLAPAAPVATPVSNTPVPSAAPAHSRASDPVTLPVTIGAGGLLAAGLLGVLARNRSLQQRRRPPRRRIAMPGIEEQLYETFLRAMADPAGLDLLDRTLRTLGLSCLDTGVELPALTAVALRPGGTVDLHLVHPAPAVAPFVGSADGRLWRCHAPDAELVTAERARDVPAPYPALVTLGRTVDGVHILADLETVRHLHLEGTPEQVAAVNRALVAELAASPLADRLRLIALGGAAPLVGSLVHGTDPGRLSTHADPELAIGELDEHRRLLEGILAECQVAHPRAARSQGVAVDVWAPVLVCTDQDLTPHQLKLLEGVLDGPEHRCAVAVTPAVPGAPGWHLDARPGHHPVAPELPFAVELQRLGAEEFAAALAALTASQRPSDLPEPAWAWAGFDAPDDEPPADDAAPDDDAVDDESTADDSADDPFIIPVLATHSRATGGGTPAAATSVPLLAADLPGGSHSGAREFSLLPVLSTAQRYVEAAAALSAPPTHVPSPVHVPSPAHASHPPAASEPGDRADVGFPPRVLLLGPVQLIGAVGATPAGTIGVSQLTALAALLFTQPEPDPWLLDAVLDPVPFAGDRLMASRSAPQARIAAMDRLRAWLGSGPDGEPWLSDTSWRLHRAVSCDWIDFQELYRLGMNSHGPAEDAALRRALDLVRGGPFFGAHQLYPWAEPVRQDMISAVIDAAHELAKRCFRVGDLPGCEAALHRGLAAVPEAEILHRGLIRLYATAGYRDHVAASITRLAQVNDALGCLDYEPETLRLFSMISSHRN